MGVSDPFLKVKNSLEKCRPIYSKEDAFSRFADLKKTHFTMQV